MLVAMSIVIGALDGFGLAMFLPLLELVSENGQVDGRMLGKLDFLINGLTGLGLSMNLITVLMVMMLFFILKAIAKFATHAYRVIIQNYFIRNLREQIISVFINLRYKYFVNAEAGRIQNTMSGEVERVSHAFFSYAATIEQSVLLLVYMAFAFFIDFRFALLVTLGGWLTNFVYKVIYKYTIGASRKFSKDSHLYQGQIIQFVSNFKYLKATAILKLYAERMYGSIRLIERSRKKIGILNAILFAAREPLLIVVVSVVIIVQTKIFQASLLPILVSLMFFYRALSALMAMQNSWNNYLAVSGSLENVTSFQQEFKSNAEPIGKIFFQEFIDSLEIKDVCFSYDTEPLLKHINLKINKNEIVAIAGESGSGKTTLVNILIGLLPVDAGEMLIDGVERSQVNIESYQKRVGYITQEPVIFNDTIFNNVTLWAEPTTENKEQCNEALRKASLDVFVQQLPAADETLLGNNGINLSGGQRQRISIARELYKEIDILIMDEATSSLDSETEKAIQDSIDKLKGKYTIIIVAHRLSTIRNADRIVMLGGGSIIANGKYNELMQNAQGFKRMVELQEL
jgi:ABC-type multidrug transport system fused ATPase/permease subunit